jgi:hypothetical protein
VQNELRQLSGNAGYANAAHRLFPRTSIGNLDVVQMLRPAPESAALRALPAWILGTRHIGPHRARP